jgi:pilus assembly protein CpaC
MMKKIILGCLSGLFAWTLLVQPIGLSTSAYAAAKNIYVKNNGAARTVQLGMNKSLVVNVEADIGDILVSNPEVVDAIVKTPQRLFLIGMALGETNIFLFDRHNNQIAVLDVSVQVDVTGLQARIKDVLPNSSVVVEGVGGSVYLKGTVGSALDAKTAVDLAAQYAGGEAKVVNALTIASNEQVFLKVTIAEVERSIIKQLGINLSGVNGAPLVKSFTPNSALSLLSSNGFNIAGQALSGSFLNLTWNDFSATLQALEQDGVVRTLAEPTLSAISGESAKFLAGGEFPVATGQDQSGNVTIEFKPFGVGLSFTPVVLSEDRISLAVETEVSSLTASGSLSVGSGGNAISIPGLTVRRASTTLEMPSGGTMVMAGLLDQRTRQSLNGWPGLKELPVLGALFRSRDYSKAQTELAIFITPYMVSPTSMDKLARPDKNLSDAGDLATIFFDRLNRRYGVANSGMPKENYHGPFGFIVK